MTENKDYNKVSVLIVGAGPAGLACAMQLKVDNPQMDICVIDKSLDLGNHNLSGAVLEKEPLHTLLNAIDPNWQQTDAAKDVLARIVKDERVMFLLGRRWAFNVNFFIKVARILGLGPGQMVHHGDYIVWVSKLVKWMGQMARTMGIEVLCGFAAEDILLDESTGRTTAVRLVDQGIDKEGHKMPNFTEGEKIYADFVVLAEGCDGLLSEKFAEKAGLQRQSPQLYSVGVKELIKVTPQQYQRLTANHVIHAMGYPLWTPLIGPSMFGGGIIYPGIEDHISVGMIVGTDWKYCDFNPQDALSNFKEHRFVKQFIDGGTVVEAGAKMIPEGGYYAIPRDKQTGSIGKDNCIIIGDSAGFVNMLKIKGLHLAIDSGIKAAKAISQSRDNPQTAAQKYTESVESSQIGKEMRSAKKFRQAIAKMGPTIGFPLSVLGGLLPRFEVEPDFEAMTNEEYLFKANKQFDKDMFTAMAATGHREEQPCHLRIINGSVCLDQCTPRFGRPCITFCPAGVYETISEQVKPANPSNCLHCKTCQRKCPFDNIRWTAPEGGGGPRYTRM